jgi:UDP-GlcNAc3NAcA epimerase
VVRKILTVVGARPQFIKAGVVSQCIRDNYSDRLSEVLIHTGQHYDNNMSDIFFKQLDLPQPKVNLEVGSGNHGEQTGRMLTLLEKVLIQEKPDMVMVYGDTNSTLAGALAAAKLHFPVAHVEAGLRSWNRKMPEEINRVMVDHISSLLLCPSEVAIKNLKQEGILKGVIKTGDVMHDSALYCAQKAEQEKEYFDRFCGENSLLAGKYFLATVHRAENTDNICSLKQIIDSFEKLPQKIVWPVHPRTQKMMEENKISCGNNIILTAPFSYLDMILFLKNAAMVLTDSGGVQKEAMFFETPCVTLRSETEWTETLESGWNILSGIDSDQILKTVESHSERIKQDAEQIYGVGKSANKVIEAALSFFN